MKKTIAILAAGLLLLSACGEKQPVPETPDTPAPMVVQYIPPAEPAPEPEPEPEPAPALSFTPTVEKGGITFASDELSGWELNGGSAARKNVSISELLSKPYGFTFSSSGPQVLIYHTHTSEAYTASEGYEYKASEPYRTLEPEHSVIRVGEEIASVLRECGIEVIHDTEFNDYPDYEASYDTALPRVKKILQENPSIRLVIDVHRDACLYNGEQLAYRKTVNGEQTAQVLLVCGDGGRQGYSGWKDNLSWALKMCAQLNRDAPELVRSIRLDFARYNQHVLPGAMLVEVGAAGNTLPEAVTAGRLFGQSLASMILSLTK